MGGVYFSSIDFYSSLKAENYVRNKQFSSTKLEHVERVK